MSEATLLRTALHDRHVELGARFTDFGGWQMPLRYGSIIEEHRAVRNAAGLFDLSHMGELSVSGPGAAAGLAGALASDPGRLPVGRAQYSLLCEPDGGVIDDLIVYRLGTGRATDPGPGRTADRAGAESFLVVPNAANRETVAEELGRRLAGHEAVLVDETLATSLVAIQGPASAAILGGLTDVDLDAVRPYGWAEGEVAGAATFIARTGYTGEDGFELFVAWSDGPGVWDALLEAGGGRGLLPCGLGARDTLRLEAGMPLYGNELDRHTTPLEAGLGRFVRLDRGVDYVGRAALEAQAARPLRKQLVGLVLRGRGIARHGYAVCRSDGATPIGRVTSGGQAPSLGLAVAMAYVPPADASPGTMLAIDVRGAAVPAEVVALPFYRRSR